MASDTKKRPKTGGLVPNTPNTYSLGPWAFFKSTNCFYILAGDKRGGTIATVARNSEFYPGDHKNAALISLAPEMYELLVELGQRVSEDDCLKIQNIVERFEKA